MKLKGNNEILLPFSSSLAGMGFSSSWVYTSLFLHQSLGLSYFLAGAVFTVSGISAAISQVYAGRLGDTIGHKVVLLSLIGISTVIYSLIFYISLFRHLPFAFSGLFVLNIAVNSGLISPLNSLVSLSSKSSLRGFSYLRMGNNVGWGFGPVIGGAIVTLYGYPYIYLFGLAMNLMNAVIALSVGNVKGMTTKRERKFSLKVNPLYIYLGLSALLLFMIQGQESVTLPNFAQSFRNLSAFDIGIVFFVNGAFVILLQVPISNLTSRIGLSRGFTLGIFLYSIGFFTMAYDFTLLGFIISMAVATIGENFAFPAGNAIVSTLSRNKDIGHYMGLFNAFISMGRSMGPVVGGIALSFVSSAVGIWGIATASGFIAIALYAATLWRKVNEEEGRSSSSQEANL